MAELPRPPTLPTNQEEFSEQVLANPSAWYEYCSAVYKHTQQQELRIQALEHETRHTALTAANGIRDY